MSRAKSLKFVKDSVSLVGASWSQGQTIPGVNRAPQEFRKAGLPKLLSQTLGYEVLDQGDIVPEGVDTSQIKGSFKFDSAKLRTLGELNRKLSDVVYQQAALDRFNVVLGGDHSLATGSLHGQLRRHGDDLKVVWVDAHADMNTLATSPSGNYHGMSLGHVLGLMSNTDVAGFEWLDRRLDPRNLVLIGIRDLDQGEIDFIKKLGIKYYTPYNIEDSGGIGNVMHEVVDHLDLKRNPTPVHVSFDVDGCDSSYVTAVGTPVDYGLTKRETSFILKHLYRTGCVVHLDVAETNTDLEQLARLKTHGDSPHISTDIPTLFTAIEFVADALGNGSQL